MLELLSFRVFSYRLPRPSTVRFLPSHPSPRRHRNIHSSLSFQTPLSAVSYVKRLYHPLTMVKPCRLRARLHRPPSFPSPLSCLLLPSLCIIGNKQSRQATARACLESSRAGSLVATNTQERMISMGRIKAMVQICMRMKRPRTLVGGK